MSKYATSTIAAAEELALVKGVPSGPSGFTSRRSLRILDDVAVVAVGTIVGATDTVRFGILPKGSQIIPKLTEISSNHTADIAGKLVFTPVDGSTGTQELTGVSIEINTAPAASIPPTASAVPVLEKDCFVEFIPTADAVIAATAKTIRARIVYSLPH
jgi:hypothetical protein